MRRLSRGRKRSKGAAGTMTWVAVGNDCPDRFDFNIGVSPACANTETLGLTILDELDLDRFEEDFTLLRIVGNIHFRLASQKDASGAINAATLLRLRWGLKREATDPSGLTLGLNMFEPDILEQSWMTVREIMLVPPVQSGVPSGSFMQDNLISWTSPYNAAQAHVDIKVKRKFATDQALNLWFSMAYAEDPNGSALGITGKVDVFACLRMLIKHD